MADLYTARLENERIKKQLADAVAELKLNAAKKDQVNWVHFEFSFCSEFLVRMSYIKINLVRFLITEFKFLFILFSHCNFVSCK